MNTSGLLQSKWSPSGFTSLQETQSIHDSRRASLTLQETRSIHDTMNLPKIEFIAYIFINN